MAKLPEINNAFLQFAEGDAPATPASGVVRIYAKSDGKMYSKDDVGVEAPLGGSSGSDAVRGICFSINNAELATTQSIAITAPMALTVTGGKLEVGTAPTGAALICDVHKNGTTLWTTQDNRPTIAADGTYAAITAPDVNSIAQGDRLLLMIDQIGSTAAGSDLSLTLYCEVA